MIHDESALNAYVKDTSFKLDSWDTLFDYVIDSEYVIKYDLKKYYYSIKIHKDDQKYFGFCFPIDGILTYFCWTVLPFGYKLGPFIAKKVMGPSIIRWRHMQIHNIIYFDDGAATSKSSNFLYKAGIQMQTDLIKCGFIPGIEKCEWSPVKIIQWNGYLWDLDRKFFAVKDSRISDFKELLRNFLIKFPKVTYREIAKLVGKIQSMYPIFDGTEQIFTRYLQSFINIRNYENLNWNAIAVTNYHELYQYCLDECLFWNKYIDKLNIRYFTVKNPSVYGWVDASSVAYGGVLLKLSEFNSRKIYTLDNLLYNNDAKKDRHISCVINELSTIFDKNKNIRDFRIHHKDFTELEMSYDSNQREILGAIGLITSSLEFLKGEVLTLYVDNENCQKILKKGSLKPRLQELAVKLWHLCNSYDITLHVTSIPRSLNKTADIISKSYDQEDYQCNVEFFRYVEILTDVHCNIDRFANNINTKCLRFNSLTSCLGTDGIDCFTQNWGKPYVNWLFPPPRLILKTLNYLCTSKGEGLLLCPQWKSAYFYTILFSEGLKKISRGTFH